MGRGMGPYVFDPHRFAVADGAKQPESKRQVTNPTGGFWIHAAMDEVNEESVRTNNTQGTVLGTRETDCNVYQRHEQSMQFAWF